MKNRVLKSISLCLLLLIFMSGMFQIPVYAAETSGTCGSNVNWSYNTSTKVLTISGTGDMSTWWQTYKWYNYQEKIYEYISEAPWELNYYNQIEEIVIKSGVKSIGKYAFYGCRKVSKVTIEDGVQSIGFAAFSTANDFVLSGPTIVNKPTIIIPNSVTQIDNFAFGLYTWPKIYCYKGSYAENYAIEKKCDYVLMCKNHVKGSPVRENEIKPTCTSTGSYYEVIYCSVCKEEISRTKKTTPASGHTYGQWINLNTNTHQRTCSVCGYKQSESHIWDAGKVTKKPTCSTTGLKTYTCTACGTTKTETVEKTNDHSYDKAIRVDSDNHYHKCTVCGNEETVAHTWDKGTIRLKPTLNTTGLRDYVCTDCGATKTEIIPKRSAGDLNGDINVDNKDVEYLLWHTLFPDKYPIDTFADFNSDGTIDNKDVEYLLWHTLFPDKYPIT